MYQLNVRNQDLPTALHAQESTSLLKTMIDDALSILANALNSIVLMFYSLFFYFLLKCTAICACSVAIFFFNFPKSVNICFKYSIFETRTVQSTSQGFYCYVDRVEESSSDAL